MILISRVNTVKLRRWGVRQEVSRSILRSRLNGKSLSYQAPIRGRTICSLHTEKVALPLLPKVKQELERIEKMGVISKVNGPTDWCAGNGGCAQGCRECSNLCWPDKVEQECLQRTPHSPCSGPHLGTAQWCKSKLDANAGFWQVKLSKESALLTTFITPFGRFCFNRLPFGITSAPRILPKAHVWHLGWTGRSGVHDRWHPDSWKHTGGTWPTTGSSLRKATASQSHT